MIKGERIAIIPARSGSKGLPNKNVLMLINKPLIAYTIEAALESKCFSRVIVSTDSLEYKEISERYGAEVLLRKDELATDLATSYMVIEDVIKKVNCKSFVLLQPTSPLRSSFHICEAIRLFESTTDINFLVSVSESNKSADLIKTLDSGNKLSNFNLDFSQYRRQNSKEYYPNGAIFIGNVEAYLNKKYFFGEDSLAYIMDKSDSVDIDDRMDFEIAIATILKSQKVSILNKNIKKRIAEKFSLEQTLAPITLLGHSIFDYWDVEELNGKKVNNFGIAGINSKQYYELIFQAGKIEAIGDTALMYFGTNDIVVDGWDEEYTIYWTKKIIEYLKKLNPGVKIYFLEVPPVLGRIERSNNDIKRINKALSKMVVDIEGVIWMPLSSNFFDSFGNLKHSFTCDGLHFNRLGYKQLEQDLTGIIK